MVEILSIKATENPNPTEPVTLAQVKKWANIEHDDDNDLLTGMITGARQDVEKETNLKVVSNTVEMVVSMQRGGKLVSLPYGPVATAITVKEIETDGQQTDKVADEDYYSISGHVMLHYAGDYRLNYTIGTTAPQALKEAIMMLVAYRYNNRGDQEKQHGLPADVERRLNNYKLVYI